MVNGYSANTLFLSLIFCWYYNIGLTTNSESGERCRLATGSVHLNTVPGVGISHLGSVGDCRSTRHRSRVSLTLGDHSGFPPRLMFCLQSVIVKTHMITKQLHIQLFKSSNRLCRS